MTRANWSAGTCIGNGSLRSNSLQRGSPGCDSVLTSGSGLRYPVGRPFLELIVSWHAHVRSVGAHHLHVAVRLRIEGMKGRLVLEAAPRTREHDPVSIR
jgi:hypothetical protein